MNPQPLNLITKMQKPDPKLGGKPYWFNVGLWFALLITLFEIVSRSFIYRSTIRVMDPVWGEVAVEKSCYRQGVEGFGVTCYAANGEIETPYHSGTSIVVMGDSYTEAHQVSNSEKFVTLTEVGLRERGYEVDMHNLGDSNRILADYIYLAPAVNKEYAPEIVIVQTNRYALRDSLNPRRKNHFIVNPDGSLSLVHRTAKEENLVFTNLIRSSGLLTFMGFRGRTVLVEDLKEDPDLDPDTEQVRSSSATRDDIRAEIQLLFHAYPNSKIVFLLMPNIPIISDAKLDWINPKDNNLLSTLNSIEGLIVVYPSQEFLDLYENNWKLPRGFNNTLPNSGHLNQYGHVAVAQALIEALEELVK